MTDFRDEAEAYRREYEAGRLDDGMVPSDPWDLFSAWFSLAVDQKLKDPNAMHLATVGTSGVPSCRVVLMRDFGHNGITFYTNYDSLKSREIEENPTVSVNFFWREMDKQIRVQGTVRKVSEEVSDRYFETRPVESQLGAWASPQSERIHSREDLVARMEELKQGFEGGKVGRPENWGGYLIVPFYFEFWQGRTGRLHDRFAYDKQGTDWKISRLAP